MPIPTFETLLHPILDLAAREPITRRSATEAMAQHTHLTPAEIEQRIPSGASTYISNRSGWAMTFLTKAGLIEKTVPKTYAATAKGREFLQLHPKDFKVADLQKLPGWDEAWEAGRARRRQNGQLTAHEQDLDVTTTPDEQIAALAQTLNQNLAAELVEQMKEMNPFRFERLVLDLLIAIGYGGSREEAAVAGKRSNDGGIDGLINEDRLGLDQLYIQAKRWENAVGRPEIQNFVGALAGHHAHKGIFITTSEFTKGALDYVKNLPQRVILIDGDRLAELMIEHNIGVSEAYAYKIKRIDSDYFEES